MTSDRIREVDDDVAHSDPPLFLKEARQWMNRWLKEDPTALPLETNRPPKETAEDLACLSGIPEDVANFRIQDQFVPQAALKKPASRGAWEKRRGEVTAQLKEKVFGWFPTGTVPFETKVTKNTGGWHIRYGYADFKEYSFQTEPGVRIRVQVLSAGNRATNAPLLIQLKRPMESFNSSDADEILPLLGKYTVVIVNPRLSELAMSPQDFADVERTGGLGGPNDRSDADLGHVASDRMAGERGEDSRLLDFDLRQGGDGLDWPLRGRSRRAGPLR
jgi:hypothetical protein